MGIRAGSLLRSSCGIRPMNTTETQSACSSTASTSAFCRRARRKSQPVLAECERRGVTLVGMVKFVGDQRWGLRLQLRDNLPGYSGPITTAIREHAELV